ncbi:MAG: hypothetical protein WC782_00180 [Methylococcaceae bacterium]|jgi:hypothetical protein
MPVEKNYLQAGDYSISCLVDAVDKDVERGEDTLMLGYSAVLLAPLFAPILPPIVLLPAMAVLFALSAILAHYHFHSIRRKLKGCFEYIPNEDKRIIKPLLEVCLEYPSHTLSESLNPLKNVKRSFNSVIGGVLINVLWIPIFYMMGMQFNEEKSYLSLNKAVIKAENKISDLNLKDS